MRSLLLISAIASMALAGAVISLTEETFEQHVGGSKAVMVKFFAPWCGHCKHLAPEYEKAAESFANSVKVELAEVDCTVQTSLCNRFDVHGYPTVKYFAKGEKTGKDFDGERNADAIVQWIQKESGAKPAGSKSNVVSLTKDTFEKIAMDSNKDAFIKFFAPWCGHCKALAPTYEKVSAAYAAEESVVIAEVNCDVEKDICSRFEVQGFPTLKFFPRGNKQGTAYTGGRDLNNFVEFLNSNLGLHRTAEGKLDATAGRVAALDAIAARFLAAEDKAALIAEAQTAADAEMGTAGMYAKNYVKVMSTVAQKGSAWLDGEKARIQKFIDGGQISLKKIDDFTIRMNILNAF